MRSAHSHRPPTTGHRGSGTHPPAIEALDLTKRFPGVVANDGASLRVERGEVHALLGENGSGKSTLCKILTGLYRPDAGQIRVNGAQVDLSSPAAAAEAGLFMVHQHFSLVDRLTVGENIMLGADRGIRIDLRKVEKIVNEAADRFQLTVDPRSYIWQLSVGERQRVEILKALYRGATTLILDEPTTVLTPQEVDGLFTTLRGLADAGNSVIFISHKLHEVLAVCDQATVLRNGRTAGTVPLLRPSGDTPARASVDTRELARMMVGREITLTRREPDKGVTRREPVLCLRQVSAVNEFGREVLSDITVDVHAGEILGIAGVAGNGQRELADVISGLRARSGGEVSVRGRCLKSGSARAAIEGGIGYVPEDRTRVGLAPGLSIVDNLMLKSFRSRELEAGPFIRKARAVQRAEKLLAEFDIKGRPSTLVRHLSGGNAQKVLLARELTGDPEVLVVAAPTRGLDVSAMLAVRDLLIQAASSGVAIVMISEDLDEIRDMSDRIAVMSRGRFVGIVDPREASLEDIGILMMGGAAA